MASAEGRKEVSNHFHICPLKAKNPIASLRFDTFFLYIFILLLFSLCFNSLLYICDLFPFIKFSVLFFSWIIYSIVFIFFSGMTQSHIPIPFLVIFFLQDNNFMRAPLSPFDFNCHERNRQHERINPKIEPLTLINSPSFLPWIHNKSVSLLDCIRFAKKKKITIYECHDAISQRLWQNRHTRLGCLLLR